MKKKFLNILLIFIFMQYNFSYAEDVEREEIKSDKIIKKIKKGENIALENFIIKGDLDFTQIAEDIQVSKNKFRSYLKNSFIFSNCIFEGKVFSFKKKDKEGKEYIVNFEKNLIFFSCEFKEEVNFKEAIINGISNFSNSKFFKKLTFEGVFFNYHNIYFTGSIFEKKVKFQRAVFSGNANFLKTKFKGKTSFQSSIFKGNAQFGASNFNERLDFSNIIVHGNLFFNQTIFYNNLLFNNSIFKNRAEFVGAKFLIDSDFTEVIFFGKTSFSEANFSGKINFTSSIFFIGKPNIENLKIDGNINFILENSKYLKTENLKDIDFKK